MTASLRLDDAVRAFLAEQGTKHLQREELWRLIGGTMRLRLTAHAIGGLPRACARADPRSLEAIEHQADALVSWYRTLAAHLGRPGRAIAPLSRLTLQAGREPVAGGTAAITKTRSAIWLREHLDHLAEHQEDLLLPARHVADIRRRPWWR